MKLLMMAAIVAFMSGSSSSSSSSTFFLLPAATAAAEEEEQQQLQLRQLQPQEECSTDLRQTCKPCLTDDQSVGNPATQTYNCTLPGLETLDPGGYEGISVNYLSFVTETSSPNFPVRAKEFEACTGGTIVFSEASNVWEDPVQDLGTKTSRGSEVYDGYFMSYSHFPEVSALGLAEHLNDRIRADNARLKWEDVLPKVRTMGEYRKDGVTNIDFLMFDGDFFVPIIRLDLLEKFDLPLPNTWEEVVEYAKFFNGTDLNGDGIEEDFGFCHFPRMGAGYWDWWWSENVYATWATSDQTEGINQGFFFDEDTMEPRLGVGFKRAAEMWKELWRHGDSAISDFFLQGRCAIGFGPPGGWKGYFLNENGIHRKDENGTVIWQPTMKSGEYAEPYRFKPFGSTSVVDRSTGEMTPCTPQLCPKAEWIPVRGHHGDNDRASVLPPSPLEGLLINRAPFYWSGGLGTLIRKSSEEVKKDLMWDFFVYTNSPETSVHDVANYASWLDSWRYTQLLPGDNFIEGGWSRQAYEEHTAIMQWALSNDVNGALNLRIPGAAKYTRDVTGAKLMQYIDGTLTLDEMVDAVRKGWNDVTMQQGKLNQLEIYRAGLALDAHTEVQSCRLHRDLMDDKDPLICRRYDESSSNYLLPAIIVPCLVAALAIFAILRLDKKRRAADAVWKINFAELKFEEPTETLGRGTFGFVILAEYRGTQVAVKRVIPPKLFDQERGDLEGQVSEGAKEGISGIDSGQISIRSLPARGGMESREQYKSFGTATLLGRTGSVDTGAYTNSVTTQPDYSKLKTDFVVEMRYLSKLRHPCITTVMGAVVEKKLEPMLVMEFMEHGSLYDILHNETIQLDGDLMLPILRDVAQGVRFLHAANPPVIHGDLKAQNVLVDSKFRAKVADFGLSAKKTVGATGSPFWMSPEILRGDTKNSRASDAYSFGIILYEMYSRKEPYEGEDPRLVLTQVMDKEITKRPPIPKACPAKIQALMTECLDGDPERRPSFEELDLQLKRYDVAAIEPGNSYLSKRARDFRTDELLREVFPKHVAEALRDGRKVEPETRDMVTVFFSDIVGFTEISSVLSPIKVSDLLGRLYSRFDELSHQYDVFKVETIGDAYMAVTNLSKDQPDHATRMANFSVEVVRAANNTLVDSENADKGYVAIRVGLHSGPVVANVVGSRNPRYCLFGDTVNTASRIESSSQRNRIHCSESTASLLRIQDPKMQVTCRGLVSLKGKGKLTTFWVNDEPCRRASM